MTKDVNHDTEVYSSAIHNLFLKRVSGKKINPSNGINYVSDVFFSVQETLGGITNCKSSFRSSLI